MRVFDPEEHMKAFEEYMKHVFGRDFGKEIGVFGIKRAPTLNTYKEKNAIVYELDFPGFKKDEVKAYVEDGLLIIEGQKKEEKSEKEKHYIYQERAISKLRREIALPENADEKKISAEFKDGVLRVKVPLKKEKKAKRISIK